MKRLDILAVLLAYVLSLHYSVKGNAEFIQTEGLHFLLNGIPFYANGFNSYWLMSMASDPSQRYIVSSTLSDASKVGLSVARTWAFSDGGSNALQSSPGVYNEQMFKALDFVVSEARRYRIRLILSFVNNYEDFGGRKQYVEWARNAGQNTATEDDFYRNPLVKYYYKNHVKAVLTRVNTVTGVAYKDDPTIFSWELINEPRCSSDLSGNTLQAWIEEMAAHVKSIDSDHLLEIGSEGFYGPSSPENRDNRGFSVGTDFLANHRVPGIDFATIHSYPDQWLANSNDQTQLGFSNNWLDTHIRDARDVIRKPLMITEFGKSQKDPGYTKSQRDILFSSVFSKIYTSARTGGSAAGSLFWQLLAKGMDSYRDGYEVILQECPSTTRMISIQSSHLRYLRRMNAAAQKAAAAKGEEEGN